MSLPIKLYLKNLVQFILKSKNFSVRWLKYGKEQDRVLNARSLSYKTVLADIVVIYDVILTLEKLASIAIVMYENKIELLSKQKNRNCL